jgi:hypothetical protein
VFQIRAVHKATKAADIKASTGFISNGGPRVLDDAWC